MPQYFFHLTNGIVVEDVDGGTFDHVAEARNHAVTVARELGRNHSSPAGRSVTVTDEQGVIVFRADIV
jgi:hypothetical protein